MLKSIFSLIKLIIKPVIALLERYHEVLEAIYHLVQISEHLHLSEWFHKALSFIEWSRLFEQFDTILMLISQYF